MIRSISAIFILLITACTSASIAKSADPVEELKACAEMTDRDTRLACFDNLGERVLREESATEKPTPEMVAQPEAAATETVTETKTETKAETETATTVTATSAPPFPDSLGGSKFGNDPVATNFPYGGLITSCKQGHYGDWFFFFDNGQVWKEVHHRNRRFKECNFNATITKGGFGYKMRIDGEEKNIGVTRHR